jgi:hypothetical protein
MKKTTKSTATDKSKVSPMSLLGFHVTPEPYSCEGVSDLIPLPVEQVRAMSFKKGTKYITGNTRGDRAEPYFKEFLGICLAKHQNTTPAKVSKNLINQCYSHFESNGFASGNDTQKFGEAHLLAVRYRETPPPKKKPKEIT